MIARPEIETWLPEGCAVEVQNVGDRTQCLYPDEVRRIAASAPGRLREFSTGRACARQALRRLGVRPQPIAVGPHREPIWPAGYTGSISHDSGLCIAVAANTNRIRAIGIDLASTAAVGAHLRELVCSPEEAADFYRWSVPEVHAIGLVFSAKEALFKATFPFTRRYVDFLEVRVKPVPEDGRWMATFVDPDLDPPIACPIEGRFLMQGATVVTAAWIAAA